MAVLGHHRPAPKGIFPVLKSDEFPVPKGVSEFYMVRADCASRTLFLRSRARKALPDIMRIRKENEKGLGKLGEERDCSQSLVRVMFIYPR